MTVARQIPAVSVVLPTRDRMGTLGVAVRSVLEQDFVDLELIVVDDGSTDGTREMLATVDDPRLVIVSMEQPGGAQAARNKGVAAARSDLIAFQDSDDEWCPGHLEALTSALRSWDDAVVAYGVVRRTPREGGTLIPGPADTMRSGDLRTVLIQYNIVNLPSSLVRASALRACGSFDVRLRRYQDWDLFLSLATHGSFAFVDDVVTLAGDAPMRITHDAEAEASALQLILEKHRQLFAARPAVEIAQRARLARLLLRTRRPAGAAAQALKVCAKPRAAIEWARAEIAGCPSLLDRDRLGVAHSP